MPNKTPTKKPFDFSKLITAAIYLLCFSSIYYYFNHIQNRELYAFINYPCEKIQPKFPGFVDFVKTYEGKLDMIRIYEAQSPFLIFSDTFEYNDDQRAYNVSLVGKTKEQILNVFLENGFKLGTYREDVDEYLKSIDEKLDGKEEVQPESS